jgi:hypothetical protein
MSNPWIVTAQPTEHKFKFDVFIQGEFYRRMIWTGVRTVIDHTVPRGNTCYFPSITEMDKAVLRVLT